MIFLRSFFFNIFLYFGIVSACIIALPLLTMRDKYMICAAKILSDYIVFLVKVFIGVAIEFRGLENLKKHEKYFIASAHQSMFETFALQTVLPGPIFILKKELIRIPLFGWCLKKIGAIDIVRDTATKENLSFFDKILDRTSKSKRPLLIFPQGTRVPYKERRPFKKGVGRIYEEIKISCQPVAINSGYVWPKIGLKGMNKIITVSVLKPISAGITKDKFIKILEDNIYSELNILN